MQPPPKPYTKNPSVVASLVLSHSSIPKTFTSRTLNLDLIDPTMAWRSGGSVTRSVISAARSSPLRSSPPLPRIRPPTTVAPGRPSRRFSLAPSRTFGELGCVQSFLPLHGMSASAHLTSRFNSNLRAFCELSHGTFRRSCQDR